MVKSLRILVVAAALCVLVLGSLTLLSSTARAVDNPCDPTYNMLKNCKANHGHWDSSCCCCRYH